MRYLIAAILLFWTCLAAEEPEREAFPVPFTAGTTKAFREVGSLPLPYGEPHDIVLTRDLALVANHTGGLCVFKVRGSELELQGRYITSAQPNVGLVREAYRGKHGLAATAVAVRGNLAFVACSIAKRFWDAYTLILVLDITDPGRIRAVACYPYGGVGQNPFWKARITGNRLLLHSDGGMRAIDISDIHRMEKVPIFKGADPKTAFVAAREEGESVCAASRDGRLLKYRRQEDGKLTVEHTLKLPGTIRDAEFVGLRLSFVFSPGSGIGAGLYLADFSEAPKLVGHAVLGKSPKRLAVGPDRTYVLDEEGVIYGLTVKDDQPELSGEWRVGKANGFAVEGGRAYVCLAGQGIASLKLGRGKPAPPAITQTAGEVLDLARNQGKIYAAGGAGGLHLVRREGNGLVKVATYQTRGPATRVFVQGRVAFVAERSAGLEIIDVSSPGAPRHLGQYQPDGEVWDVFVDGRHAFLAVDNVGLEIIDVSYPKLPVRVGLVETEAVKKGKFGDDAKENWVDRTNPRGITVKDGFAYLANGRGGMLVFDVRNPAQPKLSNAKFFDEQSGRMSSVRVAVEEKLLLSDQDNGVYLFELTKPGVPSLLSSYRMGMANAACLLGDSLYVADGAYGLKAVNVADPQKPTCGGSYHAPRIHFNDVIQDGAQLVVADSGGLRLFEASDQRVVHRTAWKLDPEGRDKPLLKGDGKPVGPQEVSALYSKPGGFTVCEDGVDVCSPRHAGHDGFEGQKRPITMDLSDKAGFPNVRVPADRVAIDPALGRIKFSDGDRDPVRRLGLQMVPMGIPDGLVRSGNLLFQSNDEGWNLIVYDITKPDSPVRTAIAATGGFSHPITASGKRCFVHNNVQGWTIFDVDDKGQPKVTGFLYAGHGAKAGGNGKHLYDGKDVWDVSKPSDPKKTTTLPEREVYGGSASYTAANGKLGKTSVTPYLVAEDTLYFLSRTDGLEVWDFRDVKSPRRLGTCEALPGLMTLDEPKKLLFILTGGSQLSIYDVADPARPRRLASTQLPRAIGGKLSAAHGLLYAVGKHFDVVDATSPTKPKLRGRIENKVSGHWENYTAVVAGPSGYAYAVYGCIGMVVIDARDRDHPKWLKKLYTNGGDFSAPGVLTRDGIAYVMSNWNGIYIVDVSDPTKPKLLSNTRSFMEPSPIGEARGCGGASLYGDFLYTTSMFLKYLNVFNISDPSAPSLATQLELPKHSHANYELPYALGGKLYLGSRNVAYDLSDPAKPALLHTDEKVTPFNVANFVSGGRRYSGNGHTGLRITDVSDPKAPKILGELPGVWVDSHYFDNPIYLKGNLLYTGSGVYGGFFHILDVSDPAKPRWLGSCEMAGIPCGVEVRGDLAYVADYYGSLQIVDVSDPTAPCLVDYWGDGAYRDEAFWDDVACIQSIWIDGDYGYATEYYSGLHILDVPRASEAPRGELTVRVVK